MKKNYTKFRLYVVRGDKRYYAVYIFNDRLSMRLFSRQIMNGSNYKFEAATHSFKAYRIVNGKEKESNMIGAILLYKGGFGVGVVAHELAHAMNYYFAKMKLKFNVGGKVNKDWKELDELYAWCLGYMNNQFWKKYYKKPQKERY